MNRIGRFCRGAVVLAVAAVAVLSGTTSAGADPLPKSTVDGWRVVAQHEVDTATQNQGVATVHPWFGRPYEYYMGNAAIRPEQRAEGWSHVGDPDSRFGFRFDAYQYGLDNPTSKMFLVTTPTGQRYEYTHPLAAGEQMNNSYAAVSLDGQWLVSGEWDTMNHLLVLPTPILNPATPRAGGTLPLAAHINLDHPVRNVQGCTFVSARQLLCATDDDGTDLYPTTKQLLRIDLPTALHGRDVTAHVTSLGQLPLASSCQGAFEVEGDDYDAFTGTLRVLVIPPAPCDAKTTVYEFRRR
ncbi:hypothetical protein F0L68_39420 [Solihabitans fulvus]|uniref:Secreted protein n=1 Tax=Solihabitans fulvus TaxID=1892852 RepID=A0A5B2WCA6_9PSEU|nr:hypothetical protein [Solihabitans fulvus]KAA2248895.1 hypothetical protein F0L68_39420 [Solihabitans fulvus]